MSKEEYKSRVQERKPLYLPSLNSYLYSERSHYGKIERDRENGRSGHKEGMEWH